MTDNLGTIHRSHHHNHSRLGWVCDRLYSCTRSLRGSSCRSDCSRSAHSDTRLYLRTGSRGGFKPQERKMFRKQRKDQSIPTQVFLSWSSWKPWLQEQWAPLVVCSQRWEHPPLFFSQLLMISISMPVEQRSQHRVNAVAFYCLYSSVIWSCKC